MTNESNKEWKERIAKKYGRTSFACRFCGSRGEHTEDCKITRHVKKYGRKPGFTTKENK